MTIKPIRDIAAPSDLPTVLHATGVAYQKKGILIVGASGSGKSSIALQLMAFGFELVSDDLVELSIEQGQVVLSAPHLAAEQTGIEARGLGILSAVPSGKVPLRFLIDLDQPSQKRVPDFSSVEIGGQSYDCLPHVASNAYPAMILQYSKYGLLA